MKSDGKNGSRLHAFLENPAKGLWTLAIPIMAGMGVHTLYTIVDMLFIGRLGGESIAAVAYNMPLFFFVMGLTFGLGSGVTATIARFIGAEDKVNADNSAEHAVAMAGIISIVLTTTGLMYGESILSFLGAKDSLLQLSWSYLKFICYGLPCMVFSGFFRSILSGEGDMKLPMIITALGTVLNIILDPIFIFLLEFGVQGAAMATMISQVVVFLIFVYMLFVKEHSYIKFKMMDFSYSNLILLEIIKVGLPASISMIIMSFGQLVFNKILTGFSVDAVAAYQIGGRIDMVVFLPIMSIAAALTTLVGMFYGAKEWMKMKSIIKYGIFRSVLITIVGSTLLITFAPWIIKSFSSEPEIQKIAVFYLRCISLIYPLVAVGMTIGRILQGMGKGLPMLIITSIRILLVSAPLAVFFTYGLGKPLEFVWYSMMISTVVATTIAVLWLRSELENITVDM
ncbi:MAG: MATE family efflux transporter [Candidatus Marinimicrobia bacterium]|jgi:putative MATE family efflux protein|nr:MATE family efflux transporter [Candidatus Neomarinimicrobiota bacterium]